MGGQPCGAAAIGIHHKNFKIARPAGVGRINDMEPVGDENDAPPVGAEGRLPVGRGGSPAQETSGRAQELSGRVVNVCSGSAHSLREILAAMSRIAGYEIKVEVNPAFVRHNEIKRLIGSNRLLHEMIGEQHHPSIEETLRWMYESSKTG